MPWWTSTTPSPTSPFRLARAAPETHKTSRGRRGLAAALVVVVLLATVFAARGPLARVGLRAVGWWFDVPAHLPTPRAPADALVVMGGDTPQRLEPGVELYRRGLASEFWYTGTHVHARSALKEAVQRGVPKSATVELHGANTWQEARQIAAEVAARHHADILVVTSWYHGRRTLCTLHQALAARGEADVQVYYQPVIGDFGPSDWWQRAAGRDAIFSELAKLVYYGVNYGLRLYRC